MRQQEMEDGKTVWYFEEQERSLTFVLRVNVMILNSFKQGRGRVLPGSDLGRRRKGQSPDRRNLHNTLQRTPSEGHQPDLDTRLTAFNLPSVSPHYVLSGLDGGTASGSSWTDPWPPRNCIIGKYFAY